MRLITAILVLLCIEGWGGLTLPAEAAKKKAKEPPKPPEQSAPVEKCLGVPFDDVAIARIKSLGLEYELVSDHTAVVKLSMILSHATEQPITIPDQIVVVFVGDFARVGLIKDGKICTLLHINEGQQLRMVLRAIHGQSVKDVGA